MNLEIFVIFEFMYDGKCLDLEISLHFSPKRENKNNVQRAAQD